MRLARSIGSLARWNIDQEMYCKSDIWAVLRTAHHEIRRDSGNVWDVLIRSCRSHHSAQHLLLRRISSHFTDELYCLEQNKCKDFARRVQLMRCDEKVRETPENSIHWHRYIAKPESYGLIGACYAAHRDKPALTSAAFDAKGVEA
nr:hypothetical protein CFP56_78818 [Quercus suber]